MELMNILKSFWVDYAKDICSLKFCNFYDCEIQPIGSEKKWVERAYYGFGLDFTTYRYGYEIKESIRNIFIPE